MTHQILIGIVGVIVLGIGAQWIAWRFRLPSILLLLLFGFVAGPVTGFLPVSSLRGDWLYAFVSVSIGIILFEGGLRLRVGELREVGKAVLNLVTVGVLVTWVLAAAGAYFMLGFEPGLAIVVGAILTVTGPTVVLPLLQHVRPAGRVGAVAKWEGITVDPVGAILAVLVLETILLLSGSAAAEGGSVSSAIAHAAEGLLLTIFISVGMSVIGAALLVFLLYRRLVPDYLQSAMALAVVVGTFGLSNSLQEESGLLEATLMGIMMANQKWVPVRRITEFKEALQVLLIGSLFVLLSARLEIEALKYMLEPEALAYLGVLILLVRPIAVAASSVRSRLTFREKAFLAWLAPRGIVAAAVSSLFAFRLERVYPGHAADLVPLVFLVIVGTVAVYGLSSSAVARWLKLAHPNPQGVLFLGATLWVQRAAQEIKKLGFRVLLIDSNTENVIRARQRDLEAQSADALSEGILDTLDLGGIGRFLALTPNDEVNSLACLNFAEIFDTNELYQLAAGSDTPGDQTRDLPQHLRGLPLFGEKATFGSLTDRFKAGGEVRVFELSSDNTYQALLNRYHDDMILLFAVRGEELLVNSPGELMPQPGDRVIVFLPPFARERDFEDEAEYDRLIADALTIDLEFPIEFPALAERASVMFAQRLPVTANTLTSGFIDGARYGAMPIAQGVALPHYRLPNIARPELLLVRCREGLKFEIGTQDDDKFPVDLSEPVYAMIFLVSPQEHPGHHLRTLANLASRIDDEDFLQSWRDAASEQQLKETLLNPDRLVSVALDEDRLIETFADTPLSEIDLPGDLRVTLASRNGHAVSLHDETIFQRGDRLTITGDPPAVHAFRDEIVS